MRREHKKEFSKPEPEQIPSRRLVTRRIPHRPGPIVQDASMQREGVASKEEGM